MRHIIFETSPSFILLCIAVALGYSFLLYRSKNPWGKSLNWALFSFRTILTFALAFLLLGPILKQTNNLFEKPVWVILQDNSISVKETTDDTQLRKTLEFSGNLQNELQKKGFDTQIANFLNDGLDETFTAQTTNIHEVLRNISNRFEGRTIAGTVLLSDGIFNSGLSPLYGHYNFPVYTVGLGDTTQRADLAIKNLVYNKIAYQGNKFPVRAEVAVKGFGAETITTTLLQGGKVLEKKQLKSDGDGVLVFDFQPLATEPGIRRWDIQIEPKSGEHNIKNNSSSVFIEIVEGRKKILLVSPAPHPDIKAIRSVIDQNSNFEFILHLPGVEETLPKNLQPENIDLALFVQSPDLRGRSREIFQRFARSRTPLMLIVGPATDLNLLAQLNLPLVFEQPPRQYDEVTPVINSAFSNFVISTDAPTTFTSFPPVQVHFGKAQIPPTANILLFQKVGSLTTEKPLLFIHQDEKRKLAMMLGEGLWRWRMDEFSRTERTASFDEVFGKLFQFLSTADDKSKFRSYPLRQQFTDTESVLFESQVYNDIFEPVFGNTIELELTHESGVKSRYSYILSPGNSRYPINGLKEGVYRYTASTTINNQREQVRGQFLVVAQQLELQNLTADFDLLRKLADQTGGKFYTTQRLEELQQNITQNEAKSIIRSEEYYDSVINLKWIFFILLTLISIEWFLRKYFGSY